MKTIIVGTPYMVQEWLRVYARRSNKLLVPYTEELQDTITALIDGKDDKWAIVDAYIRSLY